ncbi:MAG: sugar ABC transporter permease [Candidatus Micrarchaeia archaeon]
MKQKYNYLLFFLFLSPVILYLAIFFIYPLGLLFYYSLTKFDYKNKIRYFVGLENFIEIFKDPETYGHIFRTFLYTGIVVFLSFILGLGYAVLVYSIKSKLMNTLLRIIIVTPMLIMPVAGATIWRFLLSVHYGWINFILELLGFQRENWLLSPYAFYWVMITDIWGWSPYIFLIMYAALQQLPQSILDSSEVDGATSFRKYMYVIFPILKPVMIIALTLKTLDTYRAFDYIWVMTGGGPGHSSTTLNIATYITAVQYLNFEKSSAYGILTMLFPLFLTISLLIYTRVKKIE